MRSRPSGSELALRNRGIATGALRRSCSHSSRHFEPRYYREQKEESQCIWTRSEAVLEKELWIIFFSRYVAQDPMLTGILQVGTLPPQCTFWRFLTSLPVTVAQQLLQLQRILRERVWEAANVRLQSITLDTDTTVHTVYGKQMGARKSYNPKNKGKKSYQPILTFMAETREYMGGELRNGDRPDGKQIVRHLQSVFQALPKCVETIFARADSGFYCWEAVQAYQKAKVRFIMVARKTSRLLDRLQTADWKPSRKTDADQQCEFCYQPEGWGQAYRFIALRYKKKEEKSPQEREQYQLFDTPEYIYRVFVTDMERAIDLLV